MAELYQFVMGTVSTQFLQLKTTDGIYLKDLLEGDVLPSLNLYNGTREVLQRILCYNFDSAVANHKKPYSSDSFDRISALERGANRTSFDSWNKPIPIQRYGAATNMTMEAVKQMSSKDILEWHNAKLLADQKNLIKIIFQNACTKAPAGAVDEVTHLACTPKAFWNDESSMDTPRSNGQITFDGDHQHYIPVGTGGSIGTNGSELDTLIALITEHENMAGGQIVLFARQGTTMNLIRNESTNFRPINITPALVSSVGPAFSTSGLVQALIKGNIGLGGNLRVVGTWKEALVVETVDIPASYILAVAAMGEDSVNAPLAFRTHPQFPGLMLWSDSMDNPIIGKDAQYRRYLAANVWNRDAGAVLYTGNTTWAEPSFV